ncbi:MAG: hypothetical protein RB288_10165 [Bacteroidales bacterium]|nr:hypothetical protein [Bacteroidales bacterium]
MSYDHTDVIAVFDIGRTWKRFQLFDKSLNPVQTEEKIIGDVVDSEGHSCDDLPAIENWIKSCLSEVISDSIYRITAVSMAAGDGCLSGLESDLAEILKSAHVGIKSRKCHIINSSTVSLIPYLRDTDKTFILISTGTWGIFMNPFDREPLTDAQLEAGNAEIMTVAGQQVKSSRFLLGEIHDRNVAMLDDHFGVTGELYKTIKIKSKKIAKMQANKRGRTFFRHGIPEGYADSEADLTHFLTYADAYHQMMYDLVDECMGAYRLIIPEDDNTEIIYVTGGFARNDTFMRILAARLPEKRVYASTIDYATALGAAMELYSEAFDAELPPVYLGLKAILDND